MNPNSLKNLKPAEPGNCRNPYGPAGKGQNAVGKIVQLTNQHVVEVGTLVLEHNLAELKAIAEDSFGEDRKGNPASKHSALKLWMAQVALRGITKGDYYALDVFLTRVVGKVANRIGMERPDDPGNAVVASPSTPPLSVLTGSGIGVQGLSPEERRAEIARFQALLGEIRPEPKGESIPVGQSHESTNRRPDIEIKAEPVAKEDPGSRTEDKVVTAATYVEKAPNHAARPKEEPESEPGDIVAQAAIDEDLSGFDDTPQAVIKGSSDAE
jgi:hypothetical protein